MSLKIEQRLDEYFFTESEPRIYTTGAYLVPMKLRNKGKEKYIWVVDEFKDDTFNPEGVNCIPRLYVSNKSDLLKM